MSPASIFYGIKSKVPNGLSVEEWDTRVDLPHKINNISDVPAHVTMANFAK